MEDENDIEYFEFDEETALKKGFQESRDKGKLFDLTSWKLGREKSRPK